MDLDYYQIKETILKIQIETRSHKLTKLSILLHQITKTRDFNVSIIFQLKKTTHLKIKWKPGHVNCTCCRIRNRIDPCHFAITPDRYFRTVQGCV